MPDEDGRWRSDERRNWQPTEACPNCGSMRVRTEWARVTTLADPPGEEWYIPGLMDCLDCHGLQRE